MPDAEAPPGATFLPIQVVNLGAEIVFKLSASEAEAAEISTPGALREYEPFRRAFTDMAFPTSIYTEEEYAKFGDDV